MTEDFETSTHHLQQTAYFLILPKQLHELWTEYSHVRACGDHSHSNHHTDIFLEPQVYCSVDPTALFYLVFFIVSEMLFRASLLTFGSSPSLLSCCLWSYGSYLELRVCYFLDGEDERPPVSVGL